LEGNLVLDQNQRDAPLLAKARENFRNCLGRVTGIGEPDQTGLAAATGRKLGLDDDRPVGGEFLARSYEALVTRHGEACIAQQSLAIDSDQIHRRSVASYAERAGRTSCRAIFVSVRWSMRP